MSKEQNSARWNDYFQITKNRPPHDTLVKALSIFESEGLPNSEKLAFDLGCGAGRDTIYMLQHGWQVAAYDVDQDALDVLQSQLKERSFESCAQLLIGDFASLKLPPQGAVLINSSYALPFCPPENFSRLWQEISAALKEGGLFCGHFFGPNDTWAERAYMHFETRESLLDKFSHYDVAHFDEKEEDKATALGMMKHWHVFSIVAKKRTTR